jgi:hypothetical protein
LICEAPLLIGRGFFKLICAVFGTLVLGLSNLTYFTIPGSLELGCNSLLTYAGEKLGFSDFLPVGRVYRFISFKLKDR